MGIHCSIHLNGDRLCKKETNKPNTEQWSSLINLLLRRFQVCFCSSQSLLKLKKKIFEMTFKCKFPLLSCVQTNWKHHVCSWKNLFEHQSLFFLCFYYWHYEEKLDTTIQWSLYGAWHWLIFDNRRILSLQRLFSCLSSKLLLLWIFLEDHYKLACLKKALSTRSKNLCELIDTFSQSKHRDPGLPPPPGWVVVRVAANFL